MINHIEMEVMTVKWKYLNEYDKQLANALLIAVISIGSAYAWTAIEALNAFGRISSSVSEMIGRNNPEALEEIGKE